MSQSYTSVGAITSVQSVQYVHQAQARPNSNAHNGPQNLDSRDIQSLRRPLAATLERPPRSTEPKRRKTSVQGRQRIRPSSICPVSVHGEAELSGHRTWAYTQHVPAISTSSQSLNPLLSLSHPRYGLPPMLIENLAEMGIRSIYPWQSSCLLGHGLLSGDRNLVYSAPTGGGKSLVADVMMIKRILDNPGKKAILVLPYVALVQEKSAWLRRAVHRVCRAVRDEGNDWNNHSVGEAARLREQTALNVVGYFGGSKTRVTWSDVDIAVCTIEKVGVVSFTLCLMLSNLKQS